MNLETTSRALRADACGLRGWVRWRSRQFLRHLASSSFDPVHDRGNVAFDARFAQLAHSSTLQAFASPQMPTVNGWVLPDIHRIDVDLDYLGGLGEVVDAAPWGSAEVGQAAAKSKDDVGLFPSGAWRHGNPCSQSGRTTADCQPKRHCAGSL